ncbi:MAG: type III secretion system chaperone [Comamonas sp.]
MEFSAFLQEIGAAARLDTSAAARAGGCRIVFSETMEVTFEHDEQTAMVQLFAPVIAVENWSTEQRARMFASVLQLHLFGMGTGGNYFGFDAELKRIVFFRSIALAELNPAQAVQAVESFVNQLERWQAHLVRSSAQGDPELTVSEHSRELPMMRA